jgi:antitoxin HicB
MRTFVLKVILKEEEDGRWSASIPALPGCSIWGYSKQEALDNIKDAAEIYLEDMIDAGEGLPQPSEEIEFREDPAIAVSLGFTNSRVSLLENSSGHLNKMDSSTEDVKEVKGFIAILMDAVLSFIIIMLKIPYLLTPSGVSFKEQNGKRMTLDASV